MPKVDERELKAGVDEILNRHPAVGFATGVVRGSLEFFHGHGVAQVASDTPITEDTVLRIASITKTITAVAVMQLYERGLVDIDAPANKYLRAYQLVPADSSFRPATVRHLLTHTAGIPETVHPLRAVLSGYRETVKLGSPVPTLAEYYRGGIRLFAEPGTRFIYGNHGFATLGQLVEDVSGQPFAGYLRDYIFEPLGMADTDIVRSEVDRSRLATGYRLRSHGPEAVNDREVVTAPAGGVYSTARDMARYLSALLGGGANEHGRMLRPATLAMMYEPQYQPDPRVPGIGLAFWRANADGHRLVEHQGRMPGFHSQIFIAPDAGVAVMTFTNGARNATAWLPGETGSLLKRLLDVPEEVVRADVPHHPGVWRDICGWYALSGRLTDVTARMVMGAGIEVYIKGGQPWLRILSPVPALYRGIPLHPDDPQDPYVFRVDLSSFGMGSVRVIFGHDSGTGQTLAYFEFNPMSLRRQPNSTNPRFWLAGVLGAAVGATAIVRRRRPSHT
jgi:CubicO group peptidase (beta-lactamase class C family)